MKYVKSVLNGNLAAAHAIKLAKVKVIATYPITPMSPTIEKLAELIASAEFESLFVNVESEHSAMSYVIGAQLTGIRATTATSSVGLAYMHEVLGVASGCRIPIVMPVTNRALVSPWSLWCDHQDSMAERDSGWMQFYAENAQEVFDLMIMAYKIAENSSVLLPTMICYDGFFVSHSMQLVLLPQQEAIDSFLGKYEPKNLCLNIHKPLFINTLTSPDEFSEMRFQQEIGFEKALDIISDVQNEYLKFFKRRYYLFEEFQFTSANLVIICMGSIAGTVKYVISKHGLKIGCIKIISFRPFPYLQISEVLKDVGLIGVIDRSSGLGTHLGPLAMEIKSLINSNKQKLVNYIVGLGGRDVTEQLINNIIIDLINSKTKISKNWIDTSLNALRIRKINVHNDN